jgi:hypothetical protein
MVSTINVEVIGVLKGRGRQGKAIPRPSVTVVYLDCEVEVDLLDMSR